MKRTILITLVCLAIAGGAWYAFAKPPLEVEALTPATVTPDLIDGLKDTTVTFTTSFSESVRSPQVQVLLPTGKWKKLGKLADKGKSGDQSAGDGTYSLQKLIKAGSPTTFRMVARRDRKTLLVSQSFRSEWVRETIGDTGVTLSYPGDMVVSVGGAQNEKFRAIHITFDDKEIVLGIDQVIPQNQSIIEWADNQTWPFNRPWQDEMEVITVAGQPALYDRSDGQTRAIIRIARGKILYMFENGTGMDNENAFPTDVFERIVYSMSLN
ncbi:MAG: hypothetical protein AAB372_02175 [Patescibacteria group bacterium]